MYILTPHPETPAKDLSKIRVRADAKWCTPGIIQLFFDAEGDLSKLAWPMSNQGRAHSSQLDRKDGLWKHTCMEAFLHNEGEQEYWEINLSPSGEWNAYRFSGYRKDMVQELRIPLLESVAKTEKDRWALACRLDLTEIGLLGARLQVGLTAVLESTLGELSYWALHHTKRTEPDFHQPESFTLALW